MTYSEITVEIAAPPMPRSEMKIKIGSNIALSRLPATEIREKISFSHTASKHDCNARGKCKQVEPEKREEQDERK